MKGSYRIKIGNKRVRYEFVVNRNITIIQGDSATGKTTLINLIMDYYDNGVDSGVKLDCEKTCVVLHGRDWEDKLERIQDSIVFVDEGNKFVKSKDFAKAIRNTDNYYVLITREDLAMLPYSVNEIYGIHQVGKTRLSEPVYNQLYKLYGEFAESETIKPTMILAEDSNVGYEFFCNVCIGQGVKCTSAKGKSNIVKYIYDRPGEKVLIIGDGAALGPEMRKIMQGIKQHHNYMIYLPESFEWLVLKADIFRNKELMSILDNPGVHIESREYFSWERFFNKLLEDITEESGYTEKYNKIGKLLPILKNQGIVNKILQQIGNVKL